MVIANSPEEARDKFKDATAFDDAPPELNAQIESVELVEENVPSDITSMEDYLNSRDSDMPFGANKSPERVLN